MSKGWPQRPHLQESPIGGEVLHAGQANPFRRGNFAKRNSACACRSPPQQFISMKTAVGDWGSLQGLLLAPKWSVASIVIGAGSRGKWHVARLDAYP